MKSAKALGDDAARCLRRAAAHERKAAAWRARAETYYRRMILQVPLPRRRG